MTAIEQPTRAKQTRSVSQFNDLVHCGWGYYLKRVKRVPERPSVWLAGGKAFHSSTELFDRSVWDIQRLSAGAATAAQAIAALDPADFEAAFSDEFEKELEELNEQHPDVPLSEYRTAGRKTKAQPNGENIAWWRENGRVFVRTYIEWRISTADTLLIAPVAGGPGIEVEVSVPLGGVPMKGFVDRLMVNTSGDLLVVDMKSGSRTPESPIQLATYAVQLERLVGQRPLWGAYYSARHGHLSDPIDLSVFTPELLGRAFRNLDRAVTEQAFVPRIDSHCKSCGVRAACVWRGGVEPATIPTEKG